MQVVARLVGQFSRARFYRTMGPVVITAIYAVFLVLLFGTLFSSNRPSHDAPSDSLALTYLQAGQGSASIVDNRLQVTREEIRTGVDAIRDPGKRSAAMKIAVDKIRELHQNSHIEGVDIVD